MQADPDHRSHKIGRAQRPTVRSNDMESGPIYGNGPDVETLGIGRTDASETKEG